MKSYLYRNEHDTDVECLSYCDDFKDLGGQPFRTLQLIRDADFVPRVERKAMRATEMKTFQNEQFVLMMKKSSSFMTSSDFDLDRDDANCLIRTEDYLNNRKHKKFEFIFPSV